MELSVQEITKIASLTQEECKEFQGQLSQIDKHIEQDLVPGVGFDSRALEDYKKQLEKDSVNIEYLRNVVTKYLEYLAVGNTKEVHTLETVIFTVIKAQQDQIMRIQKLREQNTFWRKWMLQG